MHKMRSSIRAATGRQLKQSMKSFHSLILYRLLPLSISWYISRRIHRFCWWRSIRGCLEGGRSCEGIWSCKPWVDRLFQVKTFLYQRSLPGKDSLNLEDIFRDRTISVDLGTVHVCHLSYFDRYHIFWEELQVPRRWVVAWRFLYTCDRDLWFILRGDWLVWVLLSFWLWEVFRWCCRHLPLFFCPFYYLNL